MNEKLKNEEHPVFNDDENHIGHPQMNHDFDPSQTIVVGFGWLTAVGIILFSVFGVFLDWAPSSFQQVFVEVMIVFGGLVGSCIVFVGALLLCHFIGVFFLKLWES